MERRSFLAALLSMIPIPFLLGRTRKSSAEAFKMYYDETELGKPTYVGDFHKHYDLFVDHLSRQ